MGGKRLQSLKFAMHRILGDLGQADEFGIIAFESGVDYMSQELLDASFGNVNQARGFIDDITAGGGTYEELSHIQTSKPSIIEKADMNFFLAYVKIIFIFGVFTVWI